MVINCKWVEKHLDKEDLVEIEKAVVHAEMKSSGEIVPVLIRRSTPIGHVFPLLFLSLISFVIVLGFDQKLKYFFDIGWGTEVFVVASLFLASYFLAKVERIQRLLTSNYDMNKEVIERAELEFYHSSIKSTKGQTGILLFISFMERQAVILADKAISAKCSAETWDEVIKILIEGIKQKNMKVGIISGINRCGEILAQHLPASPKNTNELSNRLVVRDH
jgi:putative membrane protein